MKRLTYFLLTVLFTCNYGVVTRFLSPITYRKVKLKDGYYVRSTGAAIKVQNPRLRLVEGVRGFKGAVFGAGVIDASFQYVGDKISGLCLSPEQLAWRATIALGFGLVAGGVGVAAGTLAAASAGASAAWVGFGSSLYATYRLRPYKNNVLEQLTDALK